MTIRDQSNEYISALTHFAGFGLSIAGLVLLVYRGSGLGGWQVTSFAVFGATLILAYGASCLYHLWSCTHRGKPLLRRLDHAAVYLLIAGTYTPVTLVALRGGWGWSMFGVVWGVALAGTIWKLADWRLPPWLSAALYLVLGWIIVIAIAPLVRAVPATVLFWLAAGGLCYTMGAVFFGLEQRLPPRRWFGMHEVFHVFVMLGSFAHWRMMFWHFA